MEQSSLGQKKTWVVLNLPIEPIERRYSILWDRWFKEAFKRNDIPCINVYGNLGDEPKPDKFLDPISTFDWKFQQLQKCLKYLKQPLFDRHIIFLQDGWFPGIEMFPYLRDLEGIDYRMISWWHAGSYDDTDLLGIKGCSRWAKGSEESWLKIPDKIIVGSEYHRNKLLRWRNCPYNKIEIIGSPIEVPEHDYSKPRENLVIWPHRLSEDKHPEIFDKLAKEPCFKNTKFVKTMEEYRTKDQYFKLLSRAKVAVSTATHEHFGTAMVEAACLGCYPICPDSLCYPEVMEKEWLWSNYNNLIHLVCKALLMDEPYFYPHRLDFHQLNITDKVCGIIKDLAND